MLLSPDEVITHFDAVRRVSRREREYAIRVPASVILNGSLFPPQRVFRGPQVVEDSLEQATVVYICRKQALDVLHHEDRRPVIGDHLQVFDVEVLSVVGIGPVVFDSVVTGSASDRIRLARRAPDQHPSVRPLKGSPDSSVEDRSWNQPQRRPPRFAPRCHSLGRIRMEQRFDASLAAKNIVVLGRNCTRRKLAIKRSEAECFVSGVIFFDREANLERLFAIR
jgi:hypothetical protein